nr:hypothetical protein [uncultured Flavobacterium sp.]
MKKSIVLFLMVLISISCQNKPAEKKELVEKVTSENTKTEKKKALNQAINPKVQKNG